VTGGVEHDIHDVYEAEDVAVDEEVNKDRYDALDDEYELPKDFEDEEIDEDAAFNSEDERLYGHLFEGGGGKYSDYDTEDDAEDDAEESDDGEDAYGALVSDEEDGEEEEAAWPEAGEDGSEEAAGYRAEDREDRDGDSGDDMEGSFPGEEDGEEDGERRERWRAERPEMIRELYPESIYAVGPGALMCGECCD
jgi:U3 small nucleolar RNA-associated protein 14